MWPIFIGVQIAKTILLALFLPSILGSFGKIIGKGKKLIDFVIDFLYNDLF